MCGGGFVVAAAVFADRVAEQVSTRQSKEKVTVLALPRTPKSGLQVSLSFMRAVPFTIISVEGRT